MVADAIPLINFRTQLIESLVGSGKPIFNFLNACVSDCDANFSYPVGIVQSPLFPYKLYPCSMCEYTIDGSDDGSRTFQWQYFNVGNYQDGDSGLGVGRNLQIIKKNRYYKGGSRFFKCMTNPYMLILIFG